MSNLPTPPVVPKQFCGKWIAWDFDETRIIATGNTYAEAKQAAEAKGELRPVLAKAPLAEAHIVGGTR